MRKYSKIVLPVMMMLLFLVGGTYAQVTDDPVLKACEETADKLKEANIKVGGLENENKLLREMLALKDDKITIVQERADFYKKAFEDRSSQKDNNELIIANLRLQVADYKQELTDVRSENSKLRSSRDLRTVIGFGAGFASGYFIKK